MNIYYNIKEDLHGDNQGPVLYVIRAKPVQSQMSKLIADGRITHMGGVRYVDMSHVSKTELDALIRYQKEATDEVTSLEGALKRAKLRKINAFTIDLATIRRCYDPWQRCAA